MVRNVFVKPKDYITIIVLRKLYHFHLTCTTLFLLTRILSLLVFSQMGKENRNDSGNKSRNKKGFKFYMGWMHENGAAIQALSTVVLVGVTIWYATNSFRQTNIQSEALDVERQNLLLINRARIVNLGHIIGDVNGGIIRFTNIGNFPAEDFKLIWKFIYIKGTKNQQIYPEPISKTNLSSHEEKEIESKEVINPDMDIEIDYFSSGLVPEDNPVFLVIAYKYKCKGLKDIRRKEFYYYWHNTNVQQPYWILNNRDLSAGHINAVTNMMHDLRQLLKQEENN